MADLIDRKSAIDEAYAVIVDDAVYDVVQVETLEGLPSVDAVEVVRCKNCKCYEGGWYCTAWNNSPGFPMVTEEGYCNLAERRTDE